MPSPDGSRSTKFPLSCWYFCAVVLAVLWPIQGPKLRAHFRKLRGQLAHIVAMSVLGFTGFSAL